MKHEAWNPEAIGSISRRNVIRTMGVAVGAAALVPRLANAQASRAVAPPSTITQPPRDFGASGAPTTYFTDPDVLTVEPAFDGLRQPNAPIQRLWTGALWSEGPAWNAVGRYLVWSDIPNNRQLRWIEDDGHVSVFRMPSNNSNGRPTTRSFTSSAPGRDRATRTLAARATCMPSTSAPTTGFPMGSSFPAS